MLKNILGALILVIVGAVGYMLFMSPFSDNKGQTPTNQEAAFDLSTVSGDEMLNATAAADEHSDDSGDRPVDLLSPPGSELVKHPISSDVANLRNRAMAGAPDAAFDLYYIFTVCSVGNDAEYCTADKVDVDEGISMLRRSADLGYSPAQVEFLRGLYLYQGPPNEDDIELGIAYLNSAIDKGAADAMFRLAIFSVADLDFTIPTDTVSLPGNLSRIETYGHFLAAASVYEQLGIRPLAVDFINKANAQLSPNEVAEALGVANDLLGRPGCCKVWKR